MIVIVGGGFAGVTLAQRLERLLPSETQIIVLSANNHMVFKPMLPKVVGRTISPLHAVVAGRELTRRTCWREARVSRIDPKKQEAHYVCREGTEASVQYTDLVLPAGRPQPRGNSRAGVTRLSGFIAWVLWRGIYLVKLPTLSRKLEVARSWACATPFPPNIVQFRPSEKQEAQTEEKTTSKS